MGTLNNISPQTQSLFQKMYQSAEDISSARPGGRNLAPARQEIATEEKLAGKLPTSTPAAPNLNTKLPDAPKAPDVQPFDVFKQLAPTMLVLGSAFSRRSATASIKSAAAMMNAYKTGKLEEYENSRQAWQDQTKQMLDQTKLELDDFHARMESAKGNTDAITAAMNAHAHIFNDKFQIAAAQAGDQDAINIHNEKKLQAWKDIHKAMIDQEKADALISKTQPTISPGAIDKFADAIAKGVRPSSLGLGYGNNANKTAVLNRAAEKYPDMDLAEAELGFSGKGQEARTVGAAAGKIKLASNSLDQALPLARDAAKKVSLSDYPSLNALENAVQKGTGDPNIISLNTALATVVSDYAALMVRSGVPTVESRNASREMVNSAMSQGQLEAFFKQVEKEKTAQLKAIDVTRGGQADESVGVPSDVDPEIWKHMTPEEQMLWQKD